MKKHILTAGAAVLALGFSVSMAGAAVAPCPVTYQHPVKAAQIKSSLTQAFVSCGLGQAGANTPNADAEGASVTPTCFPAQTHNEKLGSPNSGWLWGPKGTASITFKAGKNKVVDPLNVDPDAVDLYITVKASDIRDGNGVADGVNGKVSSLSRATIIDRAADQLMTVIDFPTGFAVTVDGGKINKKTSATVILNNLSNQALRRCANVELLATLLLDPNQKPFATLGTFLP